MTHIEQMIQDMCPNGVEFKTLGEVCEMKRGSTITANQAEDGDIPVIAGGQKPAYFHNQSNREGKNITVAGSGAYAGYVAYWEQPIFVSDAFTVTPKEASLDIKFVYYFLTNIQDKIYHTKKGSGVPHVHPSSIADFEIPVPPIEIQIKIVECLDKFSALAAELQAELQMRRKQYEYYRTHLLTPHSESNSADKSDDRNWEWKTLGEIGKVCMCKRILKNQTNNSSGIPFYKIGSFGGVADAYIDEETYLEYKNKYSYPNKGDILISAAGTIGKSVIFDGSPSYFQDSNIVWIANDESVVLNKYLYYYYQIVEWKVDDGGVIKRLYNDNLKATKIAIPSLEEQARIVSILDKFEALTTSLSDGIPAEQAAQQKRYEYYRDLLLTFDRKAE